MMGNGNKNMWLQVLATILLVLLTYPVLEPDYGTGLDSSYVWGLNFLFDNDYTTLTHLIYPYEPLALLRLPTPFNGHYAIFLAFFTLIKTLFVFTALEMTRRRNANLLVSILLMIPVCMIGNIDGFIVGCVALMTLYTIENNRLWPFAVSALISGLALTIKLNIGLQCCSVLFIGWLIYIFIRRDLRKTIVMALTVPVALLVVGIFVYQNFSVMAEAVVGDIHLLVGYSDSLVLEPDHRLWALVVFAFIVVIYPIVLRDKWSHLLYLMLIIPLIASWKHGIVREDCSHFRSIVAFSSLMLTLVPLAQDRFRLTPWVGSVLAVFFLSLNLASLGNGKITSASPKNFITNVVNYNATIERSKKVIDYAYAKRQLPASTKAIIGDGTVDCYPWEHIYAAANNLHWQPHATVELGAGNSLWLNHKSAENFMNDNAVDFIIMHNGITTDTFDGLRSFDGRYMPSDEPEVVSAIFANYIPIDSDQFGLLLQRREFSKNIVADTIARLTVNQNEWVTLPKISDGSALRMAVKGGSSFMGHMRRMFYKPDVSTIDYLMPDSTMHTYRYSPTTAEGGLWAGPMMLSLADVADFMLGNNTAEMPTAIRLNYTHPHCHKDNIQLIFWTERY